MKVTIEMIDELRSRVNVSYEKAKEALEKNDGDLVKSIIELEKERSEGSTKYKAQKINSKANNVWDKILSIRLVVKKDNVNLMNLPIILPLGAFLMAPHVGIIAIVLIIITKCKIKITKFKSSKENIKKAMNDVTEKIKKTAEKIIEVEEEVEDEKDVDQYNEEENEIIIE